MGLEPEHVDMNLSQLLSVRLWASVSPSVKWDFDMNYLIGCGEDLTKSLSKALHIAHSPSLQIRLQTSRLLLSSPFHVQSTELGTNVKK